MSNENQKLFLSLFDSRYNFVQLMKNEQNRLNEKQPYIDGEYNSQKRIMDLNENARKRLNDYIKILTIITVGSLLFLGIRYLSNTFTFIPSFVYYILTIAILSYSLIQCFYIYVQMKGRDPLNYDRYNVSPPRILNDAQIQEAREKAANLGNLLGSVFQYNVCNGPDCCSTGTQWCSAINECIPANGTCGTSAANAFTSMFTVGNKTKYSPDEIRKMNEDAMANVRESTYDIFQNY